jgi:putative molybdopterin biosynthesis protein
MRITNQVRRLRKARGYSAAALAAKVNLTRQTIYAIEAADYAPNTAVALQLACALAVTVEDLFRLEEATPRAERILEADLLCEGPDVYDGQPVQLAQVGSRTVAVAASPTVWRLPPADAVLLKKGATRARLRLFQDGEPIGDRLVVAGCDPGISVLARHVARQGAELMPVHANSARALELLKAGLVHVAGSHLRDHVTGESNLAAVKKIFPRGTVAVFGFVLWEEGIVVAYGNPKKIRGIEDLARPGLRLINREAGSGSRQLLDSALGRLGIHPRKITGYGSAAPGHLPAAWRVRTGEADCCIATRAAARALGLDFIPLISERYDLVMYRRHLSERPVQALLDVLNRAAFRRELAAFASYDTTGAGKRIK